MSTIPTSLTKEQFDEHIRPHLSTAKRGYTCRIPLYKVFNYILYRLYTCCPWQALPIDPDPNDPEKKNSPIGQFTIIFANGAQMVVWKKYGKVAL